MTEKRNKDNLIQVIDKMNCDNLHFLPEQNCWLGHLNIHCGWQEKDDETGHYNLEDEPTYHPIRLHPATEGRPAFIETSIAWWPDMDGPCFSTNERITAETLDILIDKVKKELHHKSQRGYYL